MDRVHRRNVLTFCGASLTGVSAGCLGRSRSVDHRVNLENDDDDPRTISFAVFHEGQEIFEDSHRLQPDEEKEGYDFADSPVDGVGTYTVKAVLGENDVSSFDSLDGRERAKRTLTTNDCEGDVVIWVSEAGELDATISTC